MFRKLLLLFLLSFSLNTLGAELDPVSYIGRLMNDVVNVTEQQPARQYSSLCKIVKNEFALDVIAREVLGSFYERAEDDELEKFIAVFPRVITTRLNGFKDLLIHSEIEVEPLTVRLPNGNIQVDVFVYQRGKSDKSAYFHVRKMKDHNEIINAGVSGISLVTMWKTQYKVELRRLQRRHRDRTVDALAEKLKTKFQACE